MIGDKDLFYFMNLPHQICPTYKICVGVKIKQKKINMEVLCYGDFNVNWSTNTKNVNRKKMSRFTEACNVSQGVLSAALKPRENMRNILYGFNS